MVNARNLRSTCRRSHRLSAWFVGSLASALVISCSDSNPTNPSGANDNGDPVTLEGGSRLVFRDSGRLNDQRATIERIVNETVSHVRTLIPVDGVSIRIGAGTDLVIPAIGFGGRADAGTSVRLNFDPGSSVMAASLETELFPLLAHELHHIARQRTVGYGNTLLEAMISEGLGDQFAVEVAGIEPPRWSRALSASQLATLSARARSEWFSTSYSHDAWFFGSTPSIPLWAGYTIGFEMTGDFLRANPSRRASDLHDEPATSFVPADS